MRVDNARRLTGRGFFLPCAGAIVELWLEPGEDRARLEDDWNRQILAPLLEAIGMKAAKGTLHLRDTGLTSAVATPIDRLLAMADLLEWGALSLAGQTATTFIEAIAAYQAALAEQSNPALLALEAAAKASGVPFLWDDELVSVGLGQHAEVFPIRALPTPGGASWIDARRHRAVPVGLVTGTNGKTTTTRMVARILAEVGHVVGVSSTDAIVVGGQVVEAGDWTGPGAARRVLRDRRVTAAVLETARGGILRRGLAYEMADAALVTNIGADHFGDFGITTLDEMARVKAVVWDGVRPGGKRLANLGCAVTRAHLAAWRPDAVGAADWILLAPGGGGAEAGDALARHLAAGGEAWAIEGEALVHRLGARADVVVTLDAIPATFSGAARHNVDNALAGAALAHALGADHAAIARGLASFGARPEDNPGRLESYKIDGVRVLLDFAHNAHGVFALAPVVGRIRGPRGRLMVVTGQAGDRSDHDMAELAHAVMDLAPDRVLVRPMRGYERGRAEGETEAVLEAAFMARGLPPDAFALVDDEIAALEAGLAWARPGDVVLVLVHVQRVAVRAWLAAHARPAG